MAPRTREDHHGLWNEGSPLMVKHEKNEKENQVLSDSLSKEWKKLKGWERVLIVSVATLSVLALIAAFLPVRYHGSHHVRAIKTGKTLSVAFAGDSFQYFNDLPRFVEEIGRRDDVNIHQDSCLHSLASLPDLIEWGNGMLPRFQTKNAIIGTRFNQLSYEATEFENRLPSPGMDPLQLEPEIGGVPDFYTLYDMGACTVRQLITGYDPDLVHDPSDTGREAHHSTTRDPCREDRTYFEWTVTKYKTAPVEWDYVVLNDMSTHPAQNGTRMSTLAVLLNQYVPWFKETPTARPVFIATHGYIPFANDTSHNLTSMGLDPGDVATFTSLTYAGYQLYAETVRSLLPPHQAPLLAPSGLAFLMVHEERLDLWERLFYNQDHVHPSPTGTYLEGTVIYSTLRGRMPPHPRDLLDGDTSPKNIESLWKNARYMQHSDLPADPFPRYDDMVYLYDVAKRIHNGEKPKTLINYKIAGNGTAVVVE